MLRMWILVGWIAACGKVNGDTAICGDGAVGGVEECDEGASNGQVDSCCSATCTFVDAATVCRPTAGACDVAETCSGTSGTCPDDQMMADGASCTGNGTSACSAADTCQAGTCSNNDKPLGASCGTDACALEMCGTGGTCAAAPAQTIAIVESESSGTGNDMDTIWLGIAQGLGHTATIVPQTELDDINNLAGVDILIVSGFDIATTDARNAVIAAFATAKHGVYIQGEYLASYEGNQTFLAVVNLLGAGFTWGPDVSGDLAVVASGCFASSPNAVGTMDQNYGESGSATSAAVTPLEVVTSGNQPVAFSYCLPNGGKVLATSDKDNIRAQSAGVPAFMKNLIYRLSYPDICM